MRRIAERIIRMIVRFGFVAMSLELHDASPSKTISYTNYAKLTNDRSRLYRLKKLTEENLNNTLRIMINAHANGIEVYRITSKLVPLSTHKDVIDWDYTSELSQQFQRIKQYLEETGIRISAHPDHFTVLTSPRKEVVEASIRDLIYHDRILSAMGKGSEGKLVLHIGGVYKDKEKAIDIFKSNFSALPQNIRERIILENDDKSYTASETLKLCQELHIPMVFDVHHHLCNPDGLTVEELLDPVFNTWENQSLPPKIHYSTPKSQSSIRSHADYVDSEAFYEFLLKAKKLNKNFDVMLEAKNKDVALLKLMDDLKRYEGIKFIRGAVIEF